MLQVLVVQTDGAGPVEDTLAFGELKLEIFFRMDVLPQFGHTTSSQDPLLRTSSSKG